LTPIIIGLPVDLTGLSEVMMSNDVIIINIVFVIAVVSVLVILDTLTGGQLFFGNGLF